MSRPLAILTGASSGIGAALAPLLAREGYDLLLVARREALLTGVAERCRAAAAGARADVLALDVTAPGAARTLLERAPEARLVVNNAGFGWFGEAVDGDLENYRRMIALNVTALTEIALAFARRMVEAKVPGVVLNVASTAAFQPIPYAAVYAATKAYVVSFSEAMHYETRGKGVAVLAFCPGPTVTEFAQAAGVSTDVREKNERFFQSVDAVAASAVRAIRARAETRVPGILNNILAFLARVSYWRLARRTAALLFGQAAAKPGPAAAGAA
jgi:hypothetical protein